MDHIVTHRDHQAAPLRQFVSGTRGRLHRSGTAGEEVDTKLVVQASVNHGRWVANCPYCAGAELVDPDDLRFWCLSCDMAANGRRWLRVAMPANRAKLEAELVKRRSSANRNWIPGETLAALRRENDTNGVR